MIYYVIYILLSLLILASIVVKEKRRTIIEIIAILIVVLFQGLRWENGTDWDTYYRMFMYPSEPKYYYEFGWWLLNNIIQTTTGSYTLMLIVQCFLIVLLHIKFARYVGLNNVTSIILACFAGSIFPVRFALASGIVMVGFKYIVDKNFPKFMLCVILASAIHIASVLIIPFYFVTRKSLRFRTMILMYFISIIIGYASTSVLSVLDSANTLFSLVLKEDDLQDKIDGYMYGGIAEYSVRSAMSIFLSFCSGAFFIWLYSYFKDHHFNDIKASYQSQIYTTLLNLYVCGLCFNRIVAFAVPYLSRIGILASAGAGVLLLLGIEKKFHRKNNLLIVFIIYLIYKFILFNQVLHGQYESLYIPYNCVI